MRHERRDYEATIVGQTQKSTKRTITVDKGLNDLYQDLAFGLSSIQFQIGLNTKFN